VRDDVEVGIMEDGDRIVGFFPFHRKPGGVARPIGLGLCDYQGVVVERNADWGGEDLLRGCNLVRWEFDHLLTSQKQLSDFHVQVSGSPIIDVSQGMEGYESSLDKSGRKQLRETRRKNLKLEKEVGPLKFILFSHDRNTLEQMFQWKSLQCRETGKFDFFGLKWCVRLIERLHATREDHFGGILSSLHVGETLAAVHFVMYSRHVWHSWFPAYNHDLHAYSPGMILLSKMIESACDRDIEYIDLGKGMSLYKKRVMTDSIEVAEGRLELRSVRNAVHRFFENVEEWSRRSVLKPILRLPGRIIKSTQKRKRYD
jgi:CelD/BcsL family acetyltransferase involved in cellulose biosynthesis